MKNCILAYISLCILSGCLTYPEVERSEQFNEIYYTVLDNFEDKKGEVDGYAIWFTRGTKLDWTGSLLKDPSWIGVSRHGENNCIVSLDKRLSGEKLIHVLVHEMIHCLAFVAIPDSEYLPDHADKELWADKYGKYFHGDERYLNQNTVEYNSMNDLIYNNQGTLIDWAKGESRLSNMWNPETIFLIEDFND